MLCEGIPVLVDIVKVTLWIWPTAITFSFNIPFNGYRPCYVCWLLNLAFFTTSV